MKIHNIENFTKGWFVGDFDPSILKTKDFEVAIKEYKAGDYEKMHVHKIATEYTIIVSGTVSMNNILYKKGSIIEIEPGEYTDFESLTDSITVVVKTPCVKGDKYE
jgi:mannose-6-phosphate isomerase-like protein (cupin superfamily)